MPQGGPQHHYQQVRFEVELLWVCCVPSFVGILVVFSVLSVSCKRYWSVTTDCGEQTFCDSLYVYIHVLFLFNANVVICVSCALKFVLFFSCVRLGNALVAIYC